MSRWPYHISASLLGWAVASFCPISSRAAPAEGGAIVSPQESSEYRLLQSALQKALGEKKTFGVALATVDALGTNFISFGLQRGEGSPAIDPDSVFEIGSISKAFTGVLLSFMVNAGEVKLDEPVNKFLPEQIKAPSRHGMEITLRNLATHTSALPPLPANMKPADPENPYADYSVDAMYQFLSGCVLTRDIGSKYEYSNLGVGLLGNILSRRAKLNYEELLRKTITGPLHMPSTAVTFSAPMRSRLAVGHKADGAIASNWDLPTFAGAGGIRSSARDMAQFLGACLFPTDTSLGRAMQFSWQTRREVDAPGITMGLCWHIATYQNHSFVWHNGQTGGYHSYFGFDPAARRGVVILSDCETSLDNIGFGFLKAAY